MYAHIKEDSTKDYKQDLIYKSNNKIESFVGKQMISRQDNQNIQTALQAQIHFDESASTSSSAVTLTPYQIWDMIQSSVASPSPPWVFLVSSRYTHAHLPLPFHLPQGLLTQLLPPPFHLTFPMVYRFQCF